MKPKYVTNNGVKSSARRLKKDGVNPDIQAKLDKACVNPHIHPRFMRNK